MKIGFFTDIYFPHLDGITISVETSARALEERGHEVYIIAPRYPGYKDKKKNVYRLVSIKLPKASGTRMALQLPERTLLNVLAIDFDIIHGHPAGSGITFLGLELARVKNIPYIATYHTLFNRYTHYFFNGKIINPKMVELLTKFVGNLCDYMIAPTERVKDELIAYGVKKPIHILPSGVDIENYENVPKGFLRNKLKIPDNKKILLYIGRLGKEKSVDFLVEAFSSVHEMDPNTVFVLVGDGHEKQALKELTKQLHNEDCVYFGGLINHKHIPKVYADADVFVFASQTETQGLVITEALASGLPVVAVADEAFNEVVKNGYNGYLVPKDKNEFAKKVISIVNSHAVYATFSSQAQKSVEKFSIEKTAMHLEALYETLIRQNERTLKRKKVQRINIVQFKRLVLRARDQLNNYLEF